MSDHLLPFGLDILKHLNQVKNIKSVQSGYYRQYQTITFTFNHDGQSLEKSIIVYIKDSGHTEYKTVKLGGFETPIKVPLNEISVIQFKYGNPEYAVSYNDEPVNLFLKDCDQIAAYSGDVFAKLHAQYLLDLNQPRDQK